MTAKLYISLSLYNNIITMATIKARQMIFETESKSCTVTRLLFKKDGTESEGFHFKRQDFQEI